MKRKPWAYFDTSVLVKRYINEGGSTQARGLMRRYRFASSTIAPLEASAALTRRLAARDLTPAAFEAIAARMKLDEDHWELVELVDSVLARARQVVQRSTSSTLDAIHVASALILNDALNGKLPFFTADARQATAAERMGLRVTRIATG